jgi:ABC-type sugar transport system permease subunit
MLLYRTAFTEGNIGVAGALAVIIALLGMILSTVLVNIIRSEVKLFG